MHLAADSALVLLIRFHLQVRKQAPRTVLSLTDGQLLGEIATGQQILASDLAKALKLEQSSISRLLKGLRTKNLLRHSPDRHDRRKTVLSLSAKGIKALKDDDRARSNASFELMSAISKENQKAIIDGFRLLSDHYGIGQSRLRNNEHPLRPEQRRLSRAFGLLRGNFMGSGHSITCFHILLFLLDEGPLPLAFLVKHVPYDQSTVSRAVQSLEKQGLLASKRCLRDARAREISITPEGEGVFLDTAKACEKRIKLVLAADASAFLAALSCFNHTSTRGRLERGADGLRLRRLKTPKELSAARALLVSRELAKGPGRNISSSIFPESSDAYGIFSGETLAACWEDERHRLVNLARDPLLVPLYLLKACTGRK